MDWIQPAHQFGLAITLTVLDLNLCSAPFCLRDLGTWFTISKPPFPHDVQ